MRRDLALLVLVGLSAGTARAAAQATGTTTFNAPYRAFVRSEIGVLLSFPNGGGTALEGAYRIARYGFDLGFKAGFFTPSGAGDTELLLGAEARVRRPHQRGAGRQRGCVDRRRVGALERHAIDSSRGTF